MERFLGFIFSSDTCGHFVVWKMYAAGSIRQRWLFSASVMAMFVVE